MKMKLFLTKLEIFIVYDRHTHGQLFPSRCICRSRFTKMIPTCFISGNSLILQGTVQLDDVSRVLLSNLETLTKLECVLMTIFRTNI